MAGFGSMAAALLLASATQAGVPSRPIATAVDLGSKWGVVTSVRRSPQHNRAVGGAPNSFHLLGRAIDIARRPGVRHSQVEAAYRKAGFVLIESLDEGDHSHFAFGTPGGADKQPEAQPQRLAAAEPSVVAAACLSAGAQAAMGRRRPDRFDGCEPVEPAPKLRPLEVAP